MDKEKIERLAMLLEDAGYEGALYLIETKLVPLAIKEGISLWDAAYKYSDQDEEQDTSWFQLFHALQKIDKRPS